MERLLTGEEIKQLAGSNTRVILYPELNNCDTIEQLFGNDDKLIILYITDEEQDSIVGHWVLLTKQNRNGRNIVEFSDSYGMQPDDEIKFNSREKQERFDQKDRSLTRLLYEFSLGKKNEVHYNEMKLQKLSKGVNSCGRWVALRAKFYKIPLRHYQKIWKDLKQEGYNLDDVAVALTDELLLK